MKLYLVLVGLVALIPPQGTVQEVTALIISVNQGFVSSSGHHIPEHKGKMLIRPEGYAEGEKAALMLEGQDISVVSSAATTPRITDETKYVNVASLLGAAGTAVVKPGCVGNNPAAECTVNGRPALSARVRVTTGTVTPVEVRLRQGSTFQLSQAIARERWGFRSTATGSVLSHPLFAGASGTVVAVDVDPNEPKIRFGAEEIKLLPSASSECQAISGVSGQPCVAVWILDLPEKDSPPLPLGSEDNHFDYLYSLLRNEPREHIVPFLRMKRDLGGLPDPPGGQCLHGLLERP